MSLALNHLIAGRALAHEAALVELVPALRSAGIEPLLIKGPATIRLLYDDPNGRDSDDIDLLVRPADFPAARTVLTQHGFRPQADGARSSELLDHEETLVRAVPVPVAVDLHQALMLVPDGDALYRALGAEAQSIPLGAVTVSIPSDGGSALILALHVAQHGSGSPRAVHDLTLAVDRLGLEVWSEAARLAGRLGVGAEFAHGLTRTDAGAHILAALGLQLTAPGLEARLRLSGRGGATRRVLLALRSRDLPGLILAFRDGLAPSPSALRVHDRTIGPGRPALAHAYLTRLTRLPATGGQVAIESTQILAERLPGYVAGLLWSLRACRQAYRELHSGGLDRVALNAPPRRRPGTVRGVQHGIRLTRASCLERALVRRQWHLAQGRDIPVVIGVRNVAGECFGAHAWLQGDPLDSGDFCEIAIWPEPARRPGSAAPGSVSPG
jgi:hypothetical protein